MEPDRNKVFLGGIPLESNEDSLKDYFKAFGDVVDARIMKDRTTGRARGFGFVEFADASVAEMVLTEQHVIDGCTVEVKKAVHREDRQILHRGTSSDGIPALRNTTRTKKIFVGGLASTVTEDDFKQYFEQFGTITDAVVMYDHSTQRSRGFGFIMFDTEEAVEQALQEPLHELNGKKVEVKKAIPREVSSSRQGFGTGRSASFGTYPSPGYASSPYTPTPVARGFFSPYGPSFGAPVYGLPGIGYGNTMSGGFGGPAYSGHGHPSGPYMVGYGSGPAAAYVGIPGSYGTTGAPPSPAGVRRPWSYPGSGYADSATLAYGVEVNAHGNANWRLSSAAGQAIHTATGYSNGADNTGYNSGMSDAGGYSPNVAGYPARNARGGTGGYGDVYPQSNPYRDAQWSNESRGSPFVPAPSVPNGVTDAAGNGVAGRQLQRGPDARFRPYPASDNQLT